ncbi:uncharacterized protein IAS62_004806 [Cryptococcus decagattii]|uniref:BZIP domain-containing protein n=1 Tax=Cryptococcus decagattii TaxID=1859122 RepID=A0ABZ2AY33_9TREE
MPTPLSRQTESFNSSTGTIVPNRWGPARNTRSAAAAAATAAVDNEHTLSLSQSSQSTQVSNSGSSSSRALQPQSSLERRINNVIGVGGGDDGLMGMLQMQDVPGNSLAGWSFLGDSQPTMNHAQTADQEHRVEDFLKKIDTETVSSPMPSDSSYDRAVHLQRPSVDSYRPSTAASWHSTPSSIDHSELYSSTDVDTEDEARSGIMSHSNVGDLGLGGMDIDNLQDVEGQRSWPTEHAMAALNIAVSPQQLYANSPIPSSTGDSVSSRRRRSNTDKAVSASEDERKRLDRLEHRRDINRRSAQKHRAKRKEEIETMNRKLYVREQRIRELEMLLEAERGKVNSLEGTLQKVLGGLGRPEGNGGPDRENGR